MVDIVTHVVDERLPRSGKKVVVEEVVAGSSRRSVLPKNLIAPLPYMITKGGVWRPKAYYYTTWSYSHDQPDRLYPSRRCIIWFRTIPDLSAATQFFSSPPFGMHHEKGQQSSEPRLS